MWIDMLSLMHKGDRRGYLQLNGSPVTLSQLASMTGCDTAQATRCVAELCNSGVASALADGNDLQQAILRGGTETELCAEAGRRVDDYGKSTG